MRIIRLAGVDSMGSSAPSCVTVISIFDVPHVMTIVAERDASDVLDSRVIFSV